MKISMILMKSMIQLVNAQTNLNWKIRQVYHQRQVLFVEKSQSLVFSAGWSLWYWFWPNIHRTRSIEYIFLWLGLHLSLCKFVYRFLQKRTLTNLRNKLISIIKTGCHPFNWNKSAFLWTGDKQCISGVTLWNWQIY